LYEMATGRLPFAGASPAETVTNILEKDPIPATNLSPDRPGQLDRIITKLVAKRAEDRYQSAAALHLELERMQMRLKPGLLNRLLGRFSRHQSIFIWS
jgi:serine/threonine protein kinase